MYYVRIKQNVGDNFCAITILVFHRVLLASSLAKQKLHTENQGWLLSCQAYSDYASHNGDGNKIPTKEFAANRHAELTHNIHHENPVLLSIILITIIVRVTIYEYMYRTSFISKRVSLVPVNTCRILPFSPYLCQIWDHSKFQITCITAVSTTKHYTYHNIVLTIYECVYRTCY